MLALKVKNGFLLKDDALKEIANIPDGAVVEIEAKVFKEKRTSQQNHSYWLWLDMIASELNSSGLTVPKIIKFETLWDKDKLHMMVCKPIIKATFNKTSTTQLNKDEIDRFIDVMVEAFAYKGILLPEFPSFE